jgi:hypothetical protein
VVPVIVSVERRGGRLLASIYADWFRRDFDVDFVLYGPHLEYSVAEGVLEGVTAVDRWLSAPVPILKPFFSTSPAWAPSSALLTLSLSQIGLSLEP